MRTSIRAVVALAAGLGITGIGCGATSTTVVQPSPAKCGVEVSPASTSVGASGGTGTVTVTAQPECAWSAVPDANWISRLSPASAQGSAQVQFQTAANSGPDRSGTLTIGDQKVTVTQAGGCVYSVQPTALSIGAGGGPAAVSVSTEHGCTWSAASQTSWVVVTSGANGVGPGQATFSVASNGAAERTGTLIVAGRGVSVTQASGCTFKLDPETASFGIFGGNGSITVTPSGSGCPWTATPAQSWITIRSGASGNDVGLIVYSVNAFLGSRRTGTIMVGNRVFTVTQN